MTADAGEARPVGAAPKGSGIRVTMWGLHLALPLFALWALVVRPDLDLRWEHQVAHAAVVGGAALVAVLVGLRMGRDARQAADARLVLVALAFVVAAGFLGLHALSTPQVIVQEGNLGFVAATPVGLVLAGVLVALSAPLDSGSAARWVTAHAAWLWGGLLLAMAAWAVASLLGLPPLGNAPDPAATRPYLVAAAVVGGICFLIGVLRYWALHRRRRAAVLVSLLTAFALLGQSLLSVAYGRPWQASWWLWHVTMAMAFSFVGYAAWVQFRLEGRAAGLFDVAGGEDTIAQVNAQHRSALETLVAASHEDADPQAVRAQARLVASTFGLTERQADVLAQGAVAVATERRLRDQLRALVDLGQAARLDVLEEDLLAQAMTRGRSAFAPHDMTVVLDGDGDTLLAPGAVIAPLHVRGHQVGALVCTPSPRLALQEREVLTLRSLAVQLSVTLENLRVHRELEGLFRSYISPEVADALVADPSQADLGGAVAEVTVLFADLVGFTPYSESHDPAEVVALLNRYYGLIVPVLLDHGGTITQFVGDEVMALFGTPIRHADHPMRAARAGLALQRVIANAAGPGEPRFRVGINTGPALVGNVGSAEVRNFTAIGDTTNTAARIQAAAETGTVWVGPATHRAIAGAVRATSVGSLQLKGKAQPVAVHWLEEVLTR